MTTCQDPLELDPIELDPRKPCRDDKKRACEREHRIAESLQRILLRTHPPETLPGVLIETFYEAVLAEATIGGDSFDAFALDGGRVALVVLDASGKGLAAAERVAGTRFALRAFLREHRDPARALSCLNDFVCDAQRLDECDDGTFATLTLVVLDSASGEMVSLCAGGEPPLVLRADGETEIVPICGAALGLFPAQEYAAVTGVFSPGDAVLLMTDGLTEARRLNCAGPAGSRTGPFLGLEGVAKLAREAQNIQNQEPTGLVDQVGRSAFEGARTFAGGLFHDDACLLIGRKEAAGQSGSYRLKPRPGDTCLYARPSLMAGGM